MARNKSKGNPEEGLFYRVSSDLRDAPLSDHLSHGYSDEIDFYNALQRLIKRWNSRIGECVSVRHDFFLLRFHDTPGGRPDEEWLPRYLLQPVPVPEYMQDKSSDEQEEELDNAFGFD